MICPTSNQTAVKMSPRAVWIASAVIETGLCIEVERMHTARSLARFTRKVSRSVAFEAAFRKRVYPDALLSSTK